MDGGTDEGGFLLAEKRNEMPTGAPQPLLAITRQTAATSTITLLLYDGVCQPAAKKHLAERCLCMVANGAATSVLG
jgi:hypothetical protein